MTAAALNYTSFLEAKARLATSTGFDVDPGDVHPLLKPHQRDIVCWAVARGRAAIFTAFGTGKSVIQLETVRLTLAKSGLSRGLIVCPLGVRQEFRHDAGMLGIETTFVRRTEEASAPGIYLTNYESVRNGLLDPRCFDVVSLDEAAILRGFGGTKTFRELMRLYEGTANFRFVATATPSPNEFVELLSYAAFLDVMDVSAGKTRFFKRDSTKADKLTLHPHTEADWWLWLASWSMFLQHPSDLGYDDTGYDLPPLDVRWHEIDATAAAPDFDRHGRGHLFRDASLGVTQAAREKRESLDARVARMVEIITEGDPEMFPERRQWVVWCDLNDEQSAAARALEGLGLTVSSVHGSLSLEEAERRVLAWKNRETDVLLSKPVMLGSGVNLQQCHRAIFLGIGFKFASFIQAVHRIYRFLQTRPVRIDLVYTTAERAVRKTLERKWEQHNELVTQMGGIIREYGLSTEALHQALTRSIGVDRHEVAGDGYRLVNNDAVLEAQSMGPDSVGLILTSIPFSTQYEYTPSYNDFGHTEDNAHFWAQMDYLTPELLRVLQPGRVAAIHVKDRIAPSGLTGLGFQTVQPFHAEAIQHYMRHGFAYLGMKTVVTDVVRENNQTYRLGWTEQCKDGSRMGVGMPEYLLLFRKPPSDRSDGYADRPVVKDKDEYSLGRWQVDAHGFTRSNGDRPLHREDFADLPHEEIFKLFRAHNLTTVYDFEEHVRLGDNLKARGRLPVTFMLLQPQSWHPDVWSDITRMRTLNMQQERKGKQLHLCPMQLDLAKRAIEQYSMPGETVLDPFVGIGTVPMVALQTGRRGVGVDLNAGYLADAAVYCEAAARQASMPTLFDLVDDEAPA